MTVGPFDVSLIIPDPRITSPCLFWPSKVEAAGRDVESHSASSELSCGSYVSWQRR
jgi:hypothetical protein